MKKPRKKKNNNKKIAILASLTLVVFLLVIFFILIMNRNGGFSASGQKEAEEQDNEKSEEDSDLSEMSNRGGRIMDVLYGEASEVSQEKVVFIAWKGQVPEEFSRKTALVTEDTIIEVRSQKGEQERQADASGDSEEVKALLEESAKVKQAFYACVSEYEGDEKPEKACPQEAQRMYEINGRITDLQVGASITKDSRSSLAGLEGNMDIRVEADEDIGRKEEFTAKKIEILVKNK